MTKPFNIRLEDGDDVEIERIMKADDRDASYVIRQLVHEALQARKPVVMADDKLGHYVNVKA